MDKKLEAQKAQLAAIDQATLTPLVQSALDNKSIEVIDWKLEQLYGGIAVCAILGQGQWSRPDQGSASATVYTVHSLAQDARHRTRSGIIHCSADCRKTEW